MELRTVPQLTGRCPSPALLTLLKHSETVSMWGWPSPAWPWAGLFFPGRADSSCCSLAPRMGGKRQGAWGQGWAGRWKLKAAVENRKLFKSVKCWSFQIRRKTRKLIKLFRWAKDHNSVTEKKLQKEKSESSTNWTVKMRAELYNGAVSLVCPAVPHKESFYCKWRPARCYLIVGMPFSLWNKT